VEATRSGLMILSTPAGEVALSSPQGELNEGDEVTLGIRPEHMAESEDGALKLEGQVEAVEHLGEASLVYLRLAEGTPVVVRAPDGTAAAPGRAYRASAPERALHVFGRDGAAIPRVAQLQNRERAAAAGGDPS
jgi:ABC-type sugar transport system ATPase subunit